MRRIIIKIMSGIFRVLIVVCIMQFLALVTNYPTWLTIFFGLCSVCFILEPIINLIDKK